MKTTFIKLITAILSLTLIGSLFLAGCAAQPQSAPAGTTAASGTIAPDTEQPQTPQVSQASQQQLSYVSIDINPSIELTLASGLVIAAKAYNDDGVAILLSTDVVNMTPEAAVNALVGSFAADGYITAGAANTSIVITVAGGQDAGLADSLKQNAQQSIAGLGLQCNVVATSVAEEIVQTAENCGLSIGRYLLIKQVSMQQGISFEEAKDKYSTLKMGELLSMIEDLDSFMGDVQQLSSVLDSLTPEQLQILAQARTSFNTAMRTAQQTFLKAREDAKNAYFAARDAAKDSFLATKDKDALKTAKKQIKDAFSQAKKNATDALKAAKAQARTDFMTAIAGLGLDRETIDQLLEWDFDMSFNVDMDFSFENGESGTDNQAQDIENDDQDQTEDVENDDGQTEDVENGSHGNGNGANQDNHGNGQGRGDEQGQGNGRG